MNYLEFRKKLEPFRVFSISDIEKAIPGFLPLNLINWQKKGYIIKIRREWYCFGDQQNLESLTWLAANQIYKPSYISLQTALSFYNLIPEAIYMTTSVTTKRTNQFLTPVGDFSYNSIKKTAFGFGHTLIDSEKMPKDEVNKIRPNTRKILFAEPEKAILDFFYINHQYQTEKDMEHLRFDRFVLENNLNVSILKNYLERYECKALNDRIFNMLRAYTLI